MANLVQLRKLEELDGMLLVDKPEGIAFTSVVKTVKRKFNLVKVGHGGSLDAMASGLVVLLINDANKFVEQVMGADREYEGVLRFGERTNTGDVNGEVTATAPVELSKLESALAEFKGDIFQTEPRMAAIRKEGSAAYEIVDTGEHSQFLAHVYRFAVESIGEDAARRKFTLKASKGVIARALIDDFGAALGCGAVLEKLRRTRVGKFEVAAAVPFERLLETEIGDFADLVTPLGAALR